MKNLSIVLFFILSLNLLAKEVQIVRYEYKDKIYYGKINKNIIQPLEDNIYKELKPYGNPIPLSKVKLLIPTKPQNVFAVGMNFASHLASSSNMPPPLFFKSPSSLIGSAETIVLPRDAENVHFEGELVLIIGKKRKYFNKRSPKLYLWCYCRK